jgi:hypothetical protein
MGASDREGTRGDGASDPARAEGCLAKRRVLQLASPPTEPVMVYADEARTWLPTLANDSD